MTMTRQLTPANPLLAGLRIDRTAVLRLTAGMVPAASPQPIAVSRSGPDPDGLGRPPRRPRARMVWLVGELRRQGMLLREIAARLEIKLGYASTLLPAELRSQPVAATRRGQGGAWRRNPRGLLRFNRARQCSPAEVRQMVALRRQGLTLEQIAARTGRGETTVAVHLPAELRRLPAIEAVRWTQFAWDRLDGIQLGEPDSA